MRSCRLRVRVQRVRHRLRHQHQRQHHQRLCLRHLPQRHQRQHHQRLRLRHLPQRHQRQHHQRLRLRHLPQRHQRQHLLQHRLSICNRGLFFSSGFLSRGFFRFRLVVPCITRELYCSSSRCIHDITLATVNTKAITFIGYRVTRETLGCWHQVESQPSHPAFLRVILLCRVPPASTE